MKNAPERDENCADEERMGFTFCIPCDDCGSDGVNLLINDHIILCQSCVTERFKEARRKVRESWEH